MPIIGFLCGVLTVFAVIIFSNKVDRGLSNNTVILAGMVLSLFTSAMLTTVTSICSEDLKAITMWQMGSFAMKSWSYVLAGIPFLIIGIFMAVRYTREMDILSFGEDGAKAIGVETKKVKKTLLVSVAILTGSAVALSGVIGFIDLITPHIVRKIFGASHKIVIPMCIILGGTLMVLTDLVSRTLIAPSELPVGAITALIGAPFLHIYTLEKEVGDILLEVKNLCCGYDGNEVIHNLSFNINRGENISIIGPNGCGKSTVLKALANLIEYKGEIKLDGVEIRNIKRKDLAKKLH